VEVIDVVDVKKIIDATWKREDLTKEQKQLVAATLQDVLNCSKDITDDLYDTVAGVNTIS
jgi:hypothetical protein